MAKKNKQIDFARAAEVGVFAGTSDSKTDGDIGILNEKSELLRVGDRISLIPRRSIIPSHANKSVYDVTALDALAHDISERGIQQPLLVRQSPNGMYVIVSGHRRYTANELAIEKYGYDGEYLPCILKTDVIGSIEEREAIILDNLQRDKTDYECMMEIIEMHACADARRERGEQISSVRDWVSTKLGASQSEITRYEKIHKALIPELMEYFRKQRFATHVAHSIATTAEPRGQKYILDHWDWDKTEADGSFATLTFPEMKALLLEYDSLNRSFQDGEKEAEKPKTQKPVVKIDSVDDGKVALSGTFTSLAERVDALVSAKLSKKAEKEFLRRAGKLLRDLAEFENMVNSFAVDADETGKGV